MTTSYPQPREGIVGTPRLEDDLLWLSKKAAPRRRMMGHLAMALWSATLVGNPAPAVRRMYERMNHPQAGDLVLETGTFYLDRDDVPGMGILLAHRDEWAQTDEEYAVAYAENLNGEQGGYRAVDHDVYYVQYGPEPDDIFRWYNCSFIAIPIDRDFVEGTSFGDPTREPGQTVFTRDSIIGGLADAGFEL